MRWVYALLILMGCERQMGQWDNPYDPQGSQYHVPQLVRIEDRVDTLALGEPFPLELKLQDSNSKTFRLYFKEPTDSLQLDYTENLIQAKLLDTSLGVAKIQGMNTKLLWVSDELGLKSPVLTVKFWVLDSLHGVVLTDTNMSWGAQLSLLQGLPSGASSIRANCDTGTVDSNLNWVAPYHNDTLSCHIYYQLDRHRYQSHRHIQVLQNAPLALKLRTGPEILSAVWVKWSPGSEKGPYTLLYAANGVWSSIKAPEDSLHLVDLEFNQNYKVLVCVQSGACSDTLSFRTQNPSFTQAIPAGSFEMGSLSGDPDEGPVHREWIQEFWMDSVELSSAEKQLLLKNGLNSTDQGAARFVSWDESILMANARSRLYLLDTVYDYQWCGGRLCSLKIRDQVHGFRLPTEAMWEYAARAGTSSTWFWGDDSAQAHDYAQYGTLEPWEQGLLRPNAWGLRDMAGGLWEWTESSYMPYEGSSWALDSNMQNSRVLRGGSWREDVQVLRSSNRQYAKPDQRFDHVGVRLVYY